MNYIPVISSNIAAIAYDADGRILGVRFNHGGEYWYHGVPNSVYQSFLYAVSKGTFFGAFVRDTYACARLR
jgi:hypothetical protein